MINLKPFINLTLCLLLVRVLVNFHSSGSLVVLLKITVDWRNILQVSYDISGTTNYRKKKKVKKIPYRPMFLIVDSKAGFKMDDGAENDKIWYN